MREQILYYALKYHGEWKAIAKALGRQEPWQPVVYAGSYVTIVDEDYPASLKRLEYAPWILFYKGNIDLLHRPCAAVIGGRICSEYGRKMCEWLTSELKHRYVIVSGLAKGIDAAAHQSALDQQTIGVLGCGIDVYYPHENRQLQEQMNQTQLVISEYPGSVKPLPYHFPWRNRILAGLSQAVIVVEAKAKSGTMQTVNYGLELGLPIYCVPHAFDNLLGRGGNILISQGAQIISEEKDLTLI